MRLQPNEFSSYELSEKEEAMGWNLSLYTQAVFRNYQAGIASEILTVRAEKKELQDEERKHLAYLQGQLDSVKHLLAQASMFSENIAALVTEETTEPTAN